MTKKVNLDRLYLRAAFIEYLDQVDPALSREYLSQEIVVLIGDNKHNLDTFIIVDERVTSQDVRKSTSLALRMRDRLIDWRGYRYPGYLPLVFGSFERGKHSYAVIAHNLNRRIENILRRCLDIKQAPESHYDSEAVDKGSVVVVSRSIPEIYKDEFINLELDSAREILQALRFAENAIDPLLYEWLGYLENGDPFFSNDCPIDRDKVISAVRYWDSKNPPIVAETGHG